MVLVDTSIWVSHLRKGNACLKTLLEKAEVVCHPFIIGELACGNIANRTEILSLLHALPAAVVAKHEEVLRLIESHRLMGSGLGLIDVHLLASALLTRVPLWTADKRLRAASAELNIAYP
ncbi:TPA: VapC toxin family PIN domain ribonuclease [Candidatus Acetothermia bacterium]|nr:VapC toxin family PIN domain ribonuclease [Candidatus Acetothermia bacterium]